MFSRKRICSKCGSIARPRKQPKGSLLIEILLWLCFIIPGLLYSLWRVTGRVRACPGCAAPYMVDLRSPRGVELLNRFETSMWEKK